MLNKFSKALLFLSISITGLATQANAATSSAVLEITATVESYCQITTAPVNFGKYDPVAQNAKFATGTVELSCTQGTRPSVIRLDYGLNSAGTAVRAMSTAEAGSDLLAYELYKPLAAGGACSESNTDVWGNTVETGLAITGTPSINSPLIYNVCGKINAGQDVKHGAYKDSVTAYVDF